MGMVNYMLGVVLLLTQASAQNDVHTDFDVILTNDWHGYVKVKRPLDIDYGVICNGLWRDENCQVVCRQIGRSGGRIVNNAAQLYGTTSGLFVLNFVVCTGSENRLDQCQMSFWGQNDITCSRTQIAGCQCSFSAGITPAPAVVPTAMPNPFMTPAPVPPLVPPGNGGTPSNAATCGGNQYRLVEFDPGNYPGAGRVEVNVLGQWLSVCDDYWNDYGAVVFCRCLGYANTVRSRSYWSTQLSRLTAVPMLQDKLECTAANAASTNDLLNCSQPGVPHRCGASETAGVACSPLPREEGLASVGSAIEPDANLVCNNRFMQICFSTTEVILDPTLLSLGYIQRCPNATISTITNGLCYDVDMSVCQAVLSASPDAKSYCYNITYSAFDPVTGLVTGTDGWQRSACCAVYKNGTVMGSFTPLLTVHTAMTVDNQAPTAFSIDCFTDDSFTNTGLPTPIIVNRGQDIYCRVNSLAWDPTMYLVVPNCRFSAQPNGQPSITFHSNKCPADQNLGVDYYQLDNLHWGFKVQVPLFQGHRNVYVECDTYICDPSFEPKPYCDRSCQTTAPPPGKRRKRDVGTDPDMTDTNQATINQGPFVVTDKGYGPLVLGSDRVVVVKAPASVGVSRFLASSNSHRAPKLTVSQHFLANHSVPKLMHQPMLDFSHQGSPVSARWMADANPTPSRESSLNWQRHLSESVQQGPDVENSQHALPKNSNAGLSQGSNGNTAGSVAAAFQVRPLDVEGSANNNHRSDSQQSKESVLSSSQHDSRDWRGSGESSRQISNDKEWLGESSSQDHKSNHRNSDWKGDLKRQNLNNNHGNSDWNGDPDRIKHNNNHGNSDWNGDPDRIKHNNNYGNSDWNGDPDRKNHNNNHGNSEWNEDHSRQNFKADERKPNWVEDAVHLNLNSPPVNRHISPHNMPSRSGWMGASSKQQWHHSEHSSSGISNYPSGDPSHKTNYPLNSEQEASNLHRDEMYGDYDNIYWNTKNSITVKSKKSSGRSFRVNNYCILLSVLVAVQWIYLRF